MDEATGGRPHSFVPMREAGYVKLHRSILDWEWYADVHTRCLLLHLLVTVNYRDARFMGHPVPAGSVATSLSKLAESCGLSIQQTRTALKRLEATGEVTRQSTGSWTLVTLVNWDKYQGNGTEPTRQSTRRPTRIQQGSNTELTTIEEGKKGRMEENEEGGADATSTTRPDLTIRRQEFEQEVKTVNAALPPERRLPDQILQDFIGYWSEPTQTGNPKLKKEKQETWDTARRISTWRRLAEERGELPKSGPRKPHNPRA